MSPTAAPPRHAKKAAPSRAFLHRISSATAHDDADEDEASRDNDVQSERLATGADDGTNGGAHGDEGRVPEMSGSNNGVSDDELPDDEDDELYHSGGEEEDALGADSLRLEIVKDASTGGAVFRAKK